MHSWLWPWSGQSAAKTEAQQAAPPLQHAPPQLPPMPELSDEDLGIAVDERHAEAIHLPFSTLFVLCAYGIGFTSGFASGVQRSSLVYLAENAHRLPTTVQGWYFYNKTKNYKMILGGVSQGSRTGLRLSGWVSGWCILDIISQRGRVWAAEQFGKEPTPPGSLDPWGLGHWTDGLVAGVVAALIGAVSCA
ncbi:hypothetical protein MCUN1_000461 [Malassezia cuniculi]|uniref:Uncharacterized protein n=1 Tax=Malassezia cuniculi TaxID=948313 RepID=A0AAF0EN71_9BASI|nr:hypothetical protein MCUN1_000461 [Malassezia cuniculi]